LYTILNKSKRKSQLKKQLYGKLITKYLWEITNKVTTIANYHRHIYIIRMMKIP